MDSLGINFIAHRRRPTLLGLLLLCVGVLVFVLVALEYLQVCETLERMESRQARARPTGGNARKPPKSAVAVHTDAPAVAKAQAQLQLPWDSVLHELDGLTHPAVALLSVEGQGPTRALRLTGEAKSMADVVVYVGRLRQSHWIETAYLSHHEEVLDGAVTIIQFSLDATWKAPS